MGVPAALTCSTVRHRSAGHPPPITPISSRAQIGPAYTDKYSRFGIRVQDLFDPKIFAKKVEAALEEKNRILPRVYNTLPMEADDIIEEYLGHVERLSPHVADTSLVIHEAIIGGKEVPFEGAQGTLLDTDHGTYPFVTSSNPTAGGAVVGSGIGPKVIDEIVGVTKAYISRVGTGPFPTELNDEVGDTMIELGGDGIDGPYVVKADGLAGGKGVLVTDSRRDAVSWAEHWAEKGPVVVEEFLHGPEVSVFAVCTESGAVALEPARDYKRLLEDDEGPNTGGMGSYSPVDDLPDGLVATAMRDVIEPTCARWPRTATPSPGSSMRVWC